MVDNMGVISDDGSFKGGNRGAYRGEGFMSI